MCTIVNNSIHVQVDIVWVLQRKNKEIEIRNANASAEDKWLKKISSPSIFTKKNSEEGASRTKVWYKIRFNWRTDEGISLR